MKIKSRKPGKLKPRKSPLKIDPSRTGLERRKISREVERRFARLKREIHQLVVVEDAFGISQPTVNTRWAFLTDEGKLREFIQWLKSRVAITILAANFLREPDPNHWLQEHIQRLYFKGVSRAFDEVRKPALARSLAWYEGTRSEFLQSAFGRAVDVERVKLLAARSFAELSGVTDQMAQTIQRELVDGMIMGESPRTVGARLNKVVDGYKNRGLTIARTETLRAHNEGALDAMERLGVEEVGVMVEWSTAMDERVCPLCRALEGVVLKIKEAHGMFPRHANCRCVPIPANVGEDITGQTRTKQGIKEAIHRSVQAESPKRPLEEQLKRSRWQGADLNPSKERPKSILEE